MRKSESAAKPSSALMGISYQVFPASQQAAVRVGLVSGSVGQRGVVAPLPRLILSARKRKPPDVHAAMPRGAPDFHR
jgi:hypothetical protein